MKHPLKIKTEKVIEVSDWDNFVREVYGRPYNLQQQDGFKGQGSIRLSVPVDIYDICDFDNDAVPEEVNGDKIGVSFKSWLERDPNQKLTNKDDQEYYCLELWWNRNFYPDFYTLANDLHKKGLLPEGEYLIRIDC